MLLKAFGLGIATGLAISLPLSSAAQWAGRTIAVLSQ
jgi:hypothetical protein